MTRKHIIFTAIIASLLLAIVFMIASINFVYVHQLKRNVKTIKGVVDIMWDSHPNPDIKVNSKKIANLKKYLLDPNTRVTHNKDFKNLEKRVTGLGDLLLETSEVLVKLANDASADREIVQHLTGQVGTLSQKVSDLQLVTARNSNAVEMIMKRDGLAYYYVTGFKSGEANLSKIGKTEMTKLIKELQGYEVYLVEGFAGGTPSQRDPVIGLGRAMTVAENFRANNIPVICVPTYGGQGDYGNPKLDRCVLIFARKIQRTAPQVNASEEEVLSDVSPFSQPPMVSPARKHKIERRDEWKNKDSW